MKLLCCLVHLLTPGGLLCRTTGVLAPAQQHTNCIALLGDFRFPHSEVFLCSCVPESLTVVFCAAGNASAVREMHFYSSSSVCLLCALFLPFLCNSSSFCICLVKMHNTNSISRQYHRVSVFASVEHSTLLSGHRLICSVPFPIIRTHCTGIA
jgi:hypothetical protein